MPMTVDALLRGSEELAYDLIRSLVCRCWSAGAILPYWSDSYECIHCVGGLLITLCPIVPRIWK